MPSARLPVFEKFIGDLRAVWSAESDDARRMDKAKPLVETFVKAPDLKAHSAQWPLWMAVRIRIKMAETRREEVMDERTWHFPGVRQAG